MVFTNRRKSSTLMSCSYSVIPSFVDVEQTLADDIDVEVVVDLTVVVIAVVIELV